MLADDMLPVFLCTCFISLRKYTFYANLIERKYSKWSCLKMETQSLSSTFFDSITNESLSICADIGEMALDSFIEDGIWKDIPFLSTAVSLYKIGNSIKGRHDLKKLAIFLEKINIGCADNDKLQKRRKKFEENSKFRNQELEYCMVLIDRYISFDKAKMLAELYISYLDDIISWEEFAEFSEMVDRLLPSDFWWLFEFMCHGGIHKKDFPNTDLSPVLRLQSLGLVMTQTNLLWGEMKSKKEIFSFYITDTGEKFCEIFGPELRKFRKSSRNRI